MKKLIYGLLLLLACAGCRTPRTVYIPIQKDSLIYRVHTDSVLIYEKDSVSVSQVGDSLLVSHWKTRYRDRVKWRTIIKTIKTEVPVKVPPVVKEVTPRWAWWLLVFVLGVAVRWGFKIYGKFKLP